MARCRAVTKLGEPCRLEAAPGSEFCRVHNRRAPSPIVPVVLGEETVRVRYLGRGFFWAYGYEFSPALPERDLPQAQGLALVQRYPGLFVRVE